MRAVFVEKLWGGVRIGMLPAKRRQRHQPPTTIGVGESWEVADLPEGQSIVDDEAIAGPYAGRTLGSMVEQYGPDLVGTAHPPDRFPLLVKLIDAAEPLSVQVHPGADYAKEHPGTFSKEEAWLVVDVAAGGTVLHGFVDGVSRELFVEATRRGLPHELMRSVAVRRGDVMHVSPGIVHAIGAGVMILEVQEPSDTTFRVWDYDRVDVTGKKRPLHLEQALRVARFDHQPPPTTTPRLDAEGGLTLCETPRFSMRSMIVGGDRERVLVVPGERAMVVHVEEGEAVLTYDVGTNTAMNTAMNTATMTATNTATMTAANTATMTATLVMPQGASCVLPASCGSVVFPARGRQSRVVVMQ
jgi:mannose-6-phosphate isomerase